MKGFLLDTNIPSELTRIRPDARVIEWLESADDEALYFSVISLGEVFKGIASLQPGKRRSGLQEWVEGTLKPWFEGRILSVTEPIAERWGLLAGQCKLNGRPLKVGDGLIAVTAMVHDLVVVTRNVKDFAGLGPRIFNPWEP